MRLEKLIQLQPNEEILEIVREDLVPHAPKILIFILWLLAPFFLLYPLLQLGWIGFVVFSLFLVSAGWFGWRTFHRWSHTMFVITDQRIVDLDQRGFFQRVVTEIPLERIDQVTYEIRGVLPTVLRLGAIIVTTAGQAADLEFRRVRQPARVSALINELRRVIAEETDI
jgi:membrane protein YdbS with pleckstrin-like domain